MFAIVVLGMLVNRGDVLCRRALPGRAQGDHVVAVHVVDGRRKVQRLLSILRRSLSMAGWRARVRRVRGAIVALLAALREQLQAAVRDEYVLRQERRGDDPVGHPYEIGKVAQEVDCRKQRAHDVRRNHRAHHANAVARQDAPALGAVVAILLQHDDEEGGREEGIDHDVEPELGPSEVGRVAHDAAALVGDERGALHEDDVHDDDGARYDQQAAPHEQAPIPLVDDVRLEQQREVLADARHGHADDRVVDALAAGRSPWKHVAVAVDEAEHHAAHRLDQDAPGGQIAAIVAEHAERHARIAGECPRHAAGQHEHEVDAPHAKLRLPHVVGPHRHVLETVKVGRRVVGVAPICIEESRYHRGTR
ncbi:hypothetical protein SYNPS1DRAFT_29097 [Syncephalis pseudoplumigaleata]|uniref:Uncharacterized protein n=1 Tax=Syncephalis pseudoplumigaleata TaxID=1712513 RepID=A0A4P9YYH0_9FUNG|nr:hypothetical protein SYNPS1DRAFT_29097 [Syncephalis pseudoplumigaleata]|eukprot:RKP25156.1 hypothetical protein SYNPS1DRAFT_29097 [Syncephalis pseudoplumigaleata]